MSEMKQFRACTSAIWDNWDNGPELIWAIIQTKYDRSTLIRCICEIAEHTLEIYEKENPGDNRPRKAIEAARIVAEDNTPKKRDAAEAAADAAADAAETRRMAMTCGLTEGQTRDRLKSLERCGLVERDETGRGEFTLYVFRPFAPRVERPKKIKPTPLLDYAEKHSENPSVFQRENSTEFHRKKPSGISGGRKPATIPKPPPDQKPTKPHENKDQTAIASNDSFSGGRKSLLANLSNPFAKWAASPESSTVEPQKKRLEPLKKAKPLFISNSIDQLTPSKIRSDKWLEAFSFVRKAAPTDDPDCGHHYLAYMVAAMRSDGIIDAMTWKEIKGCITARAYNPGGVIQGKINAKYDVATVKKYRSIGVAEFRDWDKRRKAGVK